MTELRNLLLILLLLGTVGLILFSDYPPTNNSKVDLQSLLFSCLFLFDTSSPFFTYVSWGSELDGCLGFLIHKMGMVTIVSLTTLWGLHGRMKVKPLGYTRIMTCEC